MKNRMAHLLAVVIIGLTILTLAPRVPQITRAAGSASTIIGVWSTQCNSATINVTNGACGTLSPNSSISVELNITNSPSFNAYDLSLYYDSKLLNATGADATNSLFQSPFTAELDLTLGHVRFAAVDLGHSYTGSGVIGHVFFKILGMGATSLALAAGMTNPSTFAHSFTRLTLGSNPIDVSTSDGYFTNDPSRKGPVADFTFSPSSPTASTNPVTFDASLSFDPDNASSFAIKYYVWDFGDPSGPNVNLTVAVGNHIFQPIGTGFPFYGNFSVRLTVIDSDDRFVGMKTERIYVAPVLTHNVSVDNLNISPGEASAGTPLSVSVTVKDLGDFNEVFNLTVTYKAPLTTIGTVTQQNISPGQPFTKVFTLDTTGILSGSYIATANVTIAQDSDPNNNIRSATFTITAQGGNALLYLAVGVVIFAIAIVVVGLFLKRRATRRAKDEE